MTLEVKQLFSDFDFFNKILDKNSNTNDYTLDFFKEQLNNDAQIGLERFIDTEFFLQINHTDNPKLKKEYTFCFKLKNEYDKGYSPRNITFYYDIQSNTYKVKSIIYRYKDKKEYLFQIFYQSFFNEKINKIDYYNFVAFFTDDHVLTLEIDHEIAFFNSNKKSYKCFNNVETTKIGINIVERILLLKKSTNEQKEFDLLVEDVILEDCIYTGRLNKAENVFKQ